MPQVRALELLGREDPAPVGPAMQLVVFTQSIDLASAAANTASNQSTTVTGIQVNDTPIAIVMPEGTTAGVVAIPTGGPAVAANTVQVRVVNPTVGAVDATVQTMTVIALRAINP